MLPSSGELTASMFNIELGLPPTTAGRIDEAIYRTLCGKPTGTIKFSDFYGKAGSNIKQVATHSNGDTYIVTQSGNLYATGINHAGQFGLGDTNKRITFTKLPITNVEYVSCAHHVFVVLKNGEVWTAGSNTYGACGLGTTSNVTTFTRTGINNPVIMACGGGNSSYAVLPDGRLMVCGWNSDGQLGLGDITDRLTWVESPLRNVVSIDAGDVTTIALTSNGDVYVCGRQGCIGLGVAGNELPQSTWVNVRHVFPINHVVTQVSAGDNAVFCTTVDPSVPNIVNIWSAGYNHHGQLGLGTFDGVAGFNKVGEYSNVRLLGAGNNFMFINFKDGRVFATGSNMNGTLGIGTSGNNLNTFTQSNITNVRYAIGGDWHTVAIKNNGEVWGCGKNDSGQLGLGDTIDRPSWTQIDVSALT